ncbi:Hpt domain-containing protein [Chitinimonas lacunae]|uniref:Hpt domain-containing protein n=1 Tax=Chitinimonas lacunae TaxID=1963018 RepID=A0ABV8MMN3_9NEIS
MSREALEQRLNELAAQFVNELPLRLEALDSALESWLLDGDELQRRRAVEVAHSLAGSGTLFGLEEITRHARAIEEALGQPGPELLPHRVGLHLTAARARVCPPVVRFQSNITQSTK